MAARGRPKGAKNLVSKATLERVQLVFDQIGGLKAFAEWAQENKSAFYERIWAKTLPKTIEGEIDHRHTNARDLKDDELASIAAGGSEGAAVPEGGEEVSSKPH